MSKTAPVPFAEGTSSSEIGGLTVENGTDAIALYGQASLTRDKDGLDKAHALLGFLQQVVHVLEADPALPATVAPPKATGSRKNPFS